MSSDSTPVSAPASSWSPTHGSFLPGPWRYLPVVLTLVLGAVGWWTFQTIEESAREKVRSLLEIIRDADVAALEVWAESEKATAVHAAMRPEVRALARELRAEWEAGDGDRRALVFSEAGRRMAEIMNDLCKARGYTGYAIVHPDGTVLAAMNDEFVGRKGEAVHQEFVAAVARGEPQISKPFLSPVALPDSNGIPRVNMPTMLVAAPLMDAAGVAEAIVGLRIRPEVDFTRILQVARAGETGETYAVDTNGDMLSTSRFVGALRDIGLLPGNEQVCSIRNVSVRDPGVDMTTGARPDRPRSRQPLTRMAASAVTGAAGVDVSGYRDYRGVPVVGAWRWVPGLELAVATEIDKAEAFHGLFVLRLVFIIVFGILVLVALGLVFSSRLAFVMRKRASRAQDRADQLGQYTLEALLGEGGMGAVYKAHHVLLRRPTAVKMLKAQREAGPARERFEREVQLTAGLTHPNTIAVYDYGHTPEGVFYYAMEYLDGVTLDRLVKESGPLPAGRVIHILRQVCGSLDEAHGLGLIHRDIKPANIMVCQRGNIDDHVKVLDFGLVKDLGSTDALNLTSPDALTGTPNYMTPEGIQGSDLDARADLYAVGAVGYFLLTGKELFDSKSVAEVLTHHVATTPLRPSVRLGEPVPADLEALLMACLAKDPADRPQSALALELRLSECTDAGSWSRGQAETWWCDHGGRCRINKVRDLESDEALVLAVGSRVGA